MEWVYLEQMLDEMGFPRQFISWVLECVSTVNYSILVNSEPTVPFNAAKGLRQGDPISPFLFAIAMEYLSRMLNEVKGSKGFKYYPKCSTLSITHLSFAHDLLLFSRGDIEYVDTIRRCFMEFSDASGLQDNKDKSSIYFGGVTKEVQNKILQLLEFTKGDLPFRYLGIPLATKKISLIQWQPLINKMVSRITAWTAKKLSYAGRAQLIQTILFGIQAYWSQIFAISSKVLNAIEAYCRNYLWFGTNTITRKALLVWEKVCTPKSIGGL
uniref:Reverse transcriptase domain-containing protein n=2 Tax=Nicotiana TaxID=4085 RepID=A0A1S4AH97_TOBAC|nr:PREDICTED: uncharacterized protein LOC104213572 [Nicotiana sylvestris]XP_016476021.1 PREDICTED: uncharacterized protein LOC107797634 [Nicotiana tabacum]